MLITIKEVVEYENPRTVVLNMDNIVRLDIKSCPNQVSSYIETKDVNGNEETYSILASTEELNLQIQAQTIALAGG